MKKPILFLTFILASCGDKKTDNDISRSSEHSVYCIQRFLADAVAWRIDFSNLQAVTSGDLHSLPNVENDYSISLETLYDLNAGLPYGVYSGIRESDNVLVEIVINSREESTKPNSKLYSGSIKSTNSKTGADSTRRELICYDARD